MNKSYEGLMLSKCQENASTDLRTECDSARQERTNAQQQIDHLECELEGESDLKVVVEGMPSRLIMEVNQH